MHWQRYYRCSPCTNCHIAHRLGRNSEKASKECLGVSNVPLCCLSLTMVCKLVMPLLITNVPIFMHSYARETCIKMQTEINLTDHVRHFELTSTEIRQGLVSLSGRFDKSIILRRRPNCTRRLPKAVDKCGRESCKISTEGDSEKRRGAPSGLNNCLNCLAYCHTLNFK